MKVSLIQIDADDNKGNNFSKAMALLQEALEDKPSVICLPENFLYFGENKLNEAESLDSRYISAFQDFARVNGINLVLGSVALKTNLEDKVTNTSLVIDSRGEIVSRYDKMYLFDVNSNGVVMTESDTTIPGSSLGIFTLDNVKIGVGICYDLRYPEYFRALMKEGVEVIFLPSNFMELTGAIAWEYLTAARAIENQVYFCACNQTGGSGVKVRCGNTRILSYDGTVLSNLPVKEGVISAELDFEMLRKFRTEFPTLYQAGKQLNL
ncbi:MAG: nitrilase-related carbon-nitrogen hydrolase [archaeon]